MHRLEIHTFGGFEVRRDGRRLDELESRKVEALGAYLLANRGRSFRRAHLAALLWPDRPKSSGRHNLRQALYNLRSTLEHGGRERFVVDTRSVRFEPLPDDWIDLDPFERILLPDAAGAPADPRELAAAVRLYRGELLARLTVPSPELEEWLLGERERYREAVLGALRNLVDHALSTGDHELGIRYARRLVRIDSLSEEAHRQLVRLYALSGRRGRALAQYEELAALLKRQLGVEPLEETTALYRSILDGESPAIDLPAPVEPTGPVLPMVGRVDALKLLEGCWQEVLGGRGRLTLVEGAEGVGKTRLLKTFLHRAVADSGATVLQGAWFELEPPIPYRGLGEALTGLLDHELDAVERMLDETSPDDLARLALLAPRLHQEEMGPHAPVPRSAARPVSRETLAGSLARALALIARQEPAESAPSILFLEDLHWADRSSLDLLVALAPRITEHPVWILATARSGTPAARRLRDPPRGEALGLDPLTGDDLQEMAEHLVGPIEAGDLAASLEAPTGGNALVASTLVNLLWDLEALVPAEAGGWHLTVPSPELEALIARCGDGTDEIVSSRLDRLPPSARRLLSLAAVAGPRFEPALLGEIEGEEETVIEASLHTLLERWLVRLSLGYWADSRRDRDMVMWAGGARRGTFEFAHGA
ncbi:MAG: BTAD domain-containing putative transcriptional regulator, partial [Acidobacteriota bacterium]